MKKFLVDFEGEEEYEMPTGVPVGLAGEQPEFLMFSSELDGAINLCKWLSANGIPSWLIKYKHSKPLLEAGISKNTYFAAGVRRGPGVKVNEAKLSSFVPGRHYHIDVEISTHDNRTTKDADPIENADIIDIERWDE